MGIGPNVDEQELNDIASDGCVHRFSSFSEMSRVMGIAEQQIRQSTGSTDTPTQTNVLTDLPPLRRRGGRRGRRRDRRIDFVPPGRIDSRRGGGGGLITGRRRGFDSFTPPAFAVTDPLRPRGFAAGSGGIAVDPPRGSGGVLDIVSPGVMGTGTASGAFSPIFDPRMVPRRTMVSPERFF